MSLSFQTTTENKVLHLRFGQAGVRNLMDDAWFDALEAHLARAAEDPGVRVVLLSAEGDAFCSGANLKSVQHGLLAEGYEKSALSRLLRRLTRDYRTRGNDALSTLARWESVRRGEEKHIFPYQENADVMFNSSLFYEISVLRRFAEPILREVPDTVPEYGEAKRMLKFLDNFIPISPEEIPPTSLLREFIGGSSFKY